MIISEMGIVSITNFIIAVDEVSIIFILDFLI